MENTELIQVLEENAKLKEVVAKLNEVIAAINAKPDNSRDRGPQSTREMTEEDARRVVLGDHKDFSHKDAASSLGLSYGQVYSARKGFTFKTIYKELRDLSK